MNKKRLYKLLNKVIDNIGNAEIDEPAFAFSDMMAEIAPDEHEQIHKDFLDYHRSAEQTKDLKTLFDGCFCEEDGHVHPDHRTRANEWFHLAEYYEKQGQINSSLIAYAFSVQLGQTKFYDMVHAHFNLSVRRLLKHTEETLDTTDTSTPAAGAGETTPSEASIALSLLHTQLKFIIAEKSRLEHTYADFQKYKGQEPLIISLSESAARAGAGASTPPATDVPTSTANKVIEKVKANKVVTKVIDCHTYKNLDFLLLQLAHPVENRPRPEVLKDRGLIIENLHGEVKETTTTPPRLRLPRHATSRPMNSNTITVYDDAPNPKEDSLTAIKKTSTSLCDAQGKEALFMRGPGVIGLLFDIDYCDTKRNRFFFTHNSNTSVRWWLGESKSHQLSIKPTFGRGLRKFLIAPLAGTVAEGGTYVSNTHEIACEGLDIMKLSMRKGDDRTVYEAEYKDSKQSRYSLDHMLKAEREKRRFGGGEYNTEAMVCPTKASYCGSYPTEISAIEIIRNHYIQEYIIKCLGIDAPTFLRPKNKMMSESDRANFEAACTEIHDPTEFIFKACDPVLTDALLPLCQRRAQTDAELASRYAHKLFDYICERSNTSVKSVFDYLPDCADLLTMKNAESLSFRDIVQTYYPEQLQKVDEHLRKLSPPRTSGTFRSALTEQPRKLETLEHPA